MIFGLPWYAVIALVGIIGGFWSGYKQNQLKYAAKAKINSKEVEELQETVVRLTKRVENLEAIAVAEREDRPAITLDDLEIKEEPGISGKGKNKTGT